MPLEFSIHRIWHSLSEPLEDSYKDTEALGQPCVHFLLDRTKIRQIDVKNKMLTRSVIINALHLFLHTPADWHISIRSREMAHIIWSFYASANVPWLKI